MNLALENGPSNFRIFSSRAALEQYQTQAPLAPIVFITQKGYEERMLRLSQRKRNARTGRHWLGADRVTELNDKKRLRCKAMHFCLALTWFIVLMCGNLHPPLNCPDTVIMNRFAPKGHADRPFIDFALCLHRSRQSLKRQCLNIQYEIM